MGVLPKHRLAVPLLGVLLGLGALMGCTGAQPRVQMPARVLYLEGQQLADQQLYADATTKLQRVVDEHPGSRMAGFAYLRLAEINAEQGNWAEAQTNYELFLGTGSRTHLTPWVLYQLMRAQHEHSYTGLFFPEREIDRDMEPNRRIITQYKRFYLLYPQSMFLEEITGYYRAARETLAAHEHLVADFYFGRQFYNAAASRYLYLLRNYPAYPERRAVLRRLIESYRRNQQPELAEEMQAIYERHFGPGSEEAGSFDRVAASATGANEGTRSP